MTMIEIYFHGIARVNVFHICVYSRSFCVRVTQRQ